VLLLVVVILWGFAGISPFLRLLHFLEIAVSLADDDEDLHHTLYLHIQVHVLVHLLDHQNYY
jgi:hypothetical protein